MTTTVKATELICAKLDASEANERHILNGQMRWNESAKGGVNVQLDVSVVKNFIQKLRSDSNVLNGTHTSFVETAKALNDAVSFDDILTFYYNAKGEKVDIDNDKRNVRLNAFSNRIKKAFCDFLEIDVPKELNFDQTQMLAIVKSACRYFERNTRRHVPAVKVVKAKAATTAKA